MVDNIKNWYYKTTQLLQNVTENSYQKFITKCDRVLLQSAPGITKCDRLLSQGASGITKCDKLLLQSVAGITKCDSYFKVRRNTSSFFRLPSKFRGFFLLEIHQMAIFDALGQRGF